MSTCPTCPRGEANKFSAANTPLPRRSPAGKVKINVGILSGNRLLREYLHAAIRSRPEMACSILIPGALAARIPDVIVLDRQDVVRRTLQQMRETIPTVRFVVLNSDSEATDVLECVRLGVTGFVLNDAQLEDVILTIRGVAEGKAMLPEAIMARLCKQLHDDQPGNGSVAIQTGGSVTVRERQVLQLIVDGLTNKEIAGKLHIAAHTVKSHVHSLLQKFKLRTRVDLVSHCMRQLSALPDKDSARNGRLKSSGN